MKRGIRIAAVALGVVLALVGGFRGLKTLAFFHIRRIELVGGNYLTASGVARALAVPVGASIFDDVGALRRRANALPGVLRAELSRRLPGTIRVTVHEAEPVALAERSGRLVLLDAGGRALPFDPTQPASDLPIGEPDSAVAGVLARVREAEPGLYAQVERGSRIRQDVALDVGAGRILFRAGAGSGEIRDLMLVAGYLARRGQTWRELDARFMSRVFVRGIGS